jgi:hypothetical protein
MPHPLLVPVINWARNLRHPTLFKVIAALFVVDLLIPLDDLFPPYFLDELMLGLATLWLASWKQRKDPQPPQGQAGGRIIEGQSRR